MGKLHELYLGLPGTENEFWAAVELMVKHRVGKRLWQCPWFADRSEDWVQDCMLVAVKALAGRSIENADTYLWVVVGNNLTELVSGRLPDAPIEGSDDIEDKRWSGADGASALRERIDDACKDERDRRIVDMRVRGFSDPEIAVEVGISPQAVGQRRQRIEWTLDPRLNPKGSACSAAKLILGRASKRAPANGR